MAAVAKLAMSVAAVARRAKRFITRGLRIGRGELLLSTIALQIVVDIRATREGLRKPGVFHI
jgi:hypothetical protein